MSTQTNPEMQVVGNPCEICPVAADCTNPCTVFTKYVRETSPKKRESNLKDFEQKLELRGYGKKKSKTDGSYQREPVDDDNWSKPLHYGSSGFI